MYYVHAWLILRESTTEDESESLFNKIAQLGNLMQDKLNDCVPNEPIMQVNFEHILQFSVSHNHRGNAYDRLISVLTWIARELPGSYGLVYWYDDETPGRSNYDGYNVVVVARGQLMNRYDPFLSPIAPVVED
jgi:hypothetical protein